MSSDKMYPELLEEREYFDNTTLETYRKCPRRMYFRHIRNWTGEGVALPLVFGLSWHAAMDVVWKLAGSTESDLTIQGKAFKAFLETWQSEGLPYPLELEQEAALSPRTPSVAGEMIHHYIKNKRPVIFQFKVLEIEQPFAVPIFPDIADVMYIGRLDKVAQDRAGVYAYEHKTTSLYSKAYIFRSDFIESFSPNSQVDGYVHAGRMYYGNDFRSVRVDAALVHKTVHNGFKVIPINKAVNDMDAWLFDVQNWVLRLQTDKRTLRALIEEGEHLGETLRAFPRNTWSCFDKYGSCPYLEVCRQNSNPEHLDEPPEGFKEEKWEPFDVLHIDKLGLVK